MKEHLNLTEAIHFYETLILAPALAKVSLREAYGFTGSAKTSSDDWELFAAMLVRQRHSDKRHGHDLQWAEVKSAGGKGSFEYQYHLNTGVEKLDSEPGIDHIYVVHDNNLQDVTVTVVCGQLLADLFESWRPGLLKKYAEGGQRYRKNVAQSKVLKLGKVILKIENGVVTYSATEPLSDLMTSCKA